MRHLIAVPALFMCLSGTAHAVDYQQLGESVDTGKAVESVDQEKATEAVMEQGMQKGYDAVDKPTAAE